MKFTLSWLKDHLQTDATLDEIASKLTLIGLEVEGIEDPAGKLRDFTIARWRRLLRRSGKGKQLNRYHVSQYLVASTVPLLTSKICGGLSMGPK
ncbi:MAG: hypothetical protein ACLPX9_08295 [Rhodomicrobium sp.]